MKLFVFCNIHLSPLQQGLAVAQLIVELSLTLDRSYVTWAQQHKEIVVCLGGDSNCLEMLSTTFNFTTGYPIEKVVSEDGKILCVGTFIPEALGAEIDNFKKFGKFLESEVELFDEDKRLIEIISSYPRIN